MNACVDSDHCSISCGNVIKVVLILCSFVFFFVPFFSLSWCEFSAGRKFRSVSIVSSHIKY